MNFGLQRFDGVGFVRGQHIGDDVIHLHLLRNGICRARVVACEHNDACTFVLHLRDGVRRGGFDRVADRNDARERAIDRRKHHGLAVALQLLYAFAHCGRNLHRLLLHEREIANTDLLILDIGGDTFAGNRQKFLRGWQSQPARFCCLHDGLRQWMLTRLFGGCHQRKPIHTRQSKIQNVRDCRFALRDRAGFVKDDCADCGGLLQRGTVLKEDAILRAFAHANHDGCRRGETQRARTGNDQHRDGVDERRLKCGLTDQQPADKRQRCNRQHNRHKHR